MRLAVVALLACVSALPTAAQQVSPLGGTAGTVPGGSTPSLTATPGVAQPGMAQPGIAQPGIAQPGIAQPGIPNRGRRPRMTMLQRFDAANTTRDGKLTLDQAKAANMRRIVNNFDAIDTKRNGYVTIEDIRVFARAQRAARGGAAQ